jgi:chromosome segregation ATPase
MKQHGIFSVYDCDVIKGETVAHNRMDKFIDVLFTKGPKAIGVFHESLAKTYPGVFDYLTRLFTSADIDLSESRRMRPASIIDQVPDIPSYDNVSEQENVDAISQSADDDMKYWGRNISKRGLTVRRSLDVLSRQLDAIQKERNELKNALSFKEKEISDLIRSKDKNRDDLLSITQHYQEIYRNLVDWKESLTSDNSQRIQELLAERECIQAEYDALENDYTLVQLELRAARERISRLMNHLERSEQLVAFAHEERDSLQNKVLQLEGEIQKLERKNQRNYGAGRGGGGRKDAEIEQLTKQIEKSLKDIEDLRSENAELLDRLTVARQERSEALIEKDKILQKQYLEEQNRKKAENEVKNLLKRLQSLKETTESQSSEESNSLHTTSHEVNNYVVKMEDFTTVIQASEGCIIMVIMKIKLYNDN